MCVAAIAHAAAAYDFSPETDFLATTDAWPDWHETITRAGAERETVRACIDDAELCKGKLKSVRVILERGRDLTRRKQLQLVNRYVNNHRRYRDDKRRTLDTRTGERLVRQQWSTLLDFLKKGGDCEDYATAKYLILREMGISADELRIVVVYDRQVRDHHAVVAVDNGDSFALLDTDDRIYRQRPRMYRYVYAVNEKGIWAHAVDQARVRR